MARYTKDQLAGFVADPRYRDRKHPEHEAHLDFTVQAFEETYPDPVAPTPEQEEWAKREEKRLRDLVALPAYRDKRDPDHAKTFADVTRGYDKLNAVLYGTPASDGETTKPALRDPLDPVMPPPAAFARAMSAPQSAQAGQASGAAAAPRPIHQVNPPPPADPQQRYPNPNALRETDDERAQRRINQENWESQIRDQRALRLASRAPEEHDSDPMHWWRMPVPGGRIREIDAQGEGHFGARRVRPTGPAGHAGIDIEAAPGAQVVSPVDGVVVVPQGQPDDGTGRRAIVIRTDDGHQFRMLYVSRDANIRDGARVVAGQTTLGTAIDNRTLYPGAQGMTNHIHMEVHKNDRPRNPRPFMRRD
ncbi:MAG: M23 family metallopeptidase [Tagaea sp.]|nr:M23 family metallopeptidase [Tagaea sp.]